MERRAIREGNGHGHPAGEAVGKGGMKTRKESSGIFSV